MHSPAQTLKFTFHFELMIVGLQSIAGFQILKYQDQEIFRKSRSTFISHSSRNLLVWHQATKY